MPELVELKIFAQSLDAALVGKRMISAYGGRDFDANAALADKTLTQVRAHGKELFFWADERPACKAHLMLHGGFNVLDENLRPAAVDTVAEIVFAGGMHLMLYDPDGYASLTKFDVFPSTAEATEMTEAQFLALLARKRAAAVKNVLCDQKCIRGIGNAYSDEILYAARISPFVKCGAIPESERRALYRAMQAVLETAIRTYSTRYRGALGGEMRDLVQVHTRARCTPDGEVIHTRDLSGKKTYFTDSQRTFTETR